jgi:hypothetical protein
MAPFREMEFQRKMEKVLEDVRKILNTTKKPELASSVQHKYQDKYQLAEFMVSSAMASQLTCLRHLGLKQEQLSKVCAWAKEGSVTLALSGTERCSFLREQTRDVESSTKVVTEHATSEDVESWTSKVVTTIKEYFWRFEAEYILVLEFGTGGGERIVLQGRTGTHELKTTTDESPHPAVHIMQELKVDLSWLFQHQTHSEPNCLHAKFSIDRDAKSCATPRRNRDVAAAIKHFRDFSRWVASVKMHFQ